MNNNYHAMVEAMLFASSSPLSLVKLSSTIKDLGPAQVKSIIEELNQRYREGNHSFTIRKIASGYQMFSLPEYSELIYQISADRRSSRLSVQALETAAIVAYHQPITKTKINRIRGVNSEGVLSTLLERELICVVGRGDSVGRPLLYGTTKKFLCYFGLYSVEQLPKIEELEAFLKGKEDLLSTREKIQQKTKEEIAVSEKESLELRDNL